MTLIIRTITLLSVAILMTGCMQKAKYEKVVDEYLAEHLKDPGSYECVELGKPKLITPMAMAVAETNHRAAQGEFPVDSIPSKLEAIKAYFISDGTDPYDTLGWEVHHKYRARNSYGALELEEVTYILDRTQSRIKDVRRR